MLVVTTTIALKDKFDKFTAILGALFCAPVAFILPPAFHLKACAKTPQEKHVDMALMSIGFFILVYCTYRSILNW